LKYLVTGGAGFIGSHVSEALIARDDEVMILDDFSTGRATNLKKLEDAKNLKILNGSILNSEQVNDLVKDVDSVLHMAAAVGVFTIVNDPLQSIKLNLEGTKILLDACTKFEKEFFLASTSEIYGKNSSGPLDEYSDRVMGSPLKSRWIYSETKAIDESLTYLNFLKHGLKTRIARFFNTVGPRQLGNYGMVIPRFVRNALEGVDLEVYGTGEQLRCFCHVSDAVTAVLKIIDSKESVGEVFNVGNPEEISIKSLASKIILKANSKSKIKFIPYEQAYAKGFEDMNRRIPNIDKIKNVLGWSPHLSLEQIISDVIDYEKK
jgi:UDP-glucose 4-epimerase